MGTTKRAERVAATREAIIAAAERLYAEHGVATVSNRQISEAAGQGNNAAVGYHFGTKTDLVRAILRKHLEDIERRRETKLAGTGDRTELREWVEILVLPTFEHLGALGGTTWFSRFAAQLQADPVMRRIVEEEGMASPSLRQTVEGLRRRLTHLGDEAREERLEMMRQLIVLGPAAREARLASGIETPRATWESAGTGMVDAVAGLLSAPET